MQPNRPADCMRRRSSFAEELAAAAKKRGPAPKLQQQMERIQHFPRSQRRLIMQVIGSLLGDQGR